MINTQALKIFPTFADTNERQLSLLSSLLAEQNYHAGAVIYSAGEPAEALHLLSGGEVIITHKLDGNTVTLARLRPGYFFGESGLLIPKHRHQTHAQAVSDSLVLKLSTANFLKLKQSEPGLALSLFSWIGNVLSERLTENSMRIGILSTLGRALNKALVSGNVGRLSEEILRIAAKAANCQKGFFGLYQKYNSQHLKITGALGLSAKELPRELPADIDPYLQKLSEESEEIAVPAERYEQGSKVFYAKRNLLARLIKTGQEKIGAIVLVDKQGGDFTLQNSLMLEIVASQAATALSSLAARQEREAREELAREYVGM